MNAERRRSRGNASRTPGRSPTRNDPLESATRRQDAENASNTPGTSRPSALRTTPASGRHTPSARPPSSLRFEVRAEDGGRPGESTTPAGPASTRNPGRGSNTPQNYLTPSGRSLRQPQGRGSARQIAGVTPHKQAAEQVKEMRRRALINTPGRARRMSGRLQRNDPMDNLRRLARNLAPKSQAIPSSSSPSDTAQAAAPTPKKDEDDDDDDMILEEPRSRISLHSDSDSDLEDPRRERELQEAVERTRVLEDIDLTTYSVELPRRMGPAWPEDARLTRRSSMFEAINEAESDDGDVGAMPFQLDSSPQRRLPFADDSDFRIEVPEEPPLSIEESTFAMDEALGRDSGRQSDFQLPVMDQDASVLEAAAEDLGMFDAPGLDDVGDEDEAGEEEAEGDMSDSDGDVEVVRTFENDARRSEPLPGLAQKHGRKSKRHALAIPDKHVKKIAGRFMKRNGGNIRFSRETLDRLGIMTDWFFERLGKSLEAYAGHAGRKTIRESDVHLVMKRYVIFYPGYIFSLPLPVR
ncbi:hypothetical protein GQ53DRAFT_444330 [Thozetella sp. PMI_491]|nr:hypothetical protein GQ53DRAFT_444330 [Thozetella sp. PMI_491]